MGTYENLASTALRLIDRFGRSGTHIVRRGESAPSDPNRPWKLDGAAAPDVVVATSAKAAFFREERTQSGQVLVTNSTAKVLIAAPSVTTEPLESDIVVSGIKKYEVLRVERLGPGDVPVAYALHCKE